MTHGPAVDPPGVGPRGTIACPGRASVNDDERVHVEAPLPQDFDGLITDLRNRYGTASI